MKATAHYSPVLLFIMLYKVALTFESMGKEYSTVVLFKNYAVQGGSVDEILKCNHSNESY